MVRRIGLRSRAVSPCAAGGGRSGATSGGDDGPISGSIRQPFEQLGSEAMDQLLALVGGGTAEPGRTLLAPRLVVRASTQGPADEQIDAGEAQAGEKAQ